MAYTAMYRKYRPLVFTDVVEQEYVVKALRNSIITGKIAHAYLLCGTRGTGKTTLAKIFARAINCLNPENGNPCNKCEICKSALDGSLLDIIEMDAASNNGVDSVRSIREDISYAPTIAKYKVYIIDEVHMLSTSAFNALLKTLEEPPAHSVFILATTDPQKLPETILSRCQRYDMKRITVSGIADRIEKIAGEGGITLDRESAEYIADLADGALRDGINILDRCAAVDTIITPETVSDVTGAMDRSFIYGSCGRIFDGDVCGLLNDTDRLMTEGRRIQDYIDSLLKTMRALMAYIVSDGKMLSSDSKLNEFCNKYRDSISTEYIIDSIKELGELSSQIKWSAIPKVYLESELARLALKDKVGGGATMQHTYSAPDNRIKDLEMKIMRLSTMYDELAHKLDSHGSNSVIQSNPSAALSATAKYTKIASEDLSKYKTYERWNKVMDKLRDLKYMTQSVFFERSRVICVTDSVLAVIMSADEKMSDRKDIYKDSVARLTEAATAVEGKPVEIIIINENGAAKILSEKEKAVADARKLAEKLETELEIE